MADNVTRRGFLGLGAGLSAAAFLAACSPSTNTSGASGAASGGTKRIVAGEWGGVWDKALQVVTPPFTQRTGIEVLNSVTTGGQLTVIEQNPGQYDMNWLIGSDAARGFKSGVLDAIDTSKIKNLDAIIPRLKDGQMVDGKLTGVPISYGANGILWRKDKVPFEIKSWKDLWRPELKGQIAIQNAPSIGGLFLIYAAGQAYGNGPDDFEAGWKALERLKDNVQFLYTVSSDPINKIASGAVSVVVTIADQGIPLKGQNVEVTVPQEGAAWSLQNITIPVASKNKDLAYEFINYMLEDETQIAWSKNAKIAPASTAVQLPSDVQANLVEDDAVADRLWPIDWLQLGENIEDWTTRWQRIFT